MTDPAAIGNTAPEQGRPIDRGTVKRAVLAVLVVAFLVFGAQMTLTSRTAWAAVLLVRRLRRRGDRLDPTPA